MSLRSFGAHRCLKSLAGLATALALAGCGGDVFNAFDPTRVYSFGDGHSVVASDGRKYTVNNPADCRYGPTWNQYVVDQYGFVFSACNPGNLTGNRVAQLFADEAWTLADVRAQVEAQLPNLGTGDMVLLQVGMQDVWALYQQDPTLDAPAEFPGCSDANLGATLRTACERGADLGRLIQQITDRDARVLAIDVVNQGKTPRGLAESAQGRRLLKALTDAFNSGFYNSFGNNSRKAAYAQVNNLVRLATDDDSNTGTRFRNETSPACTVPSALDCTLSTVSADYRENINDYRFVYADDLYFTPQMNRLIGRLAWSRAERHPY
jgi:lysophospholipase L1-like esterase